VRTLRAVSPVVATALLVLIAVATAVLLYLWVSGTVTNQPTNNPALQEAIKIEAIYNDTSPNVYAYIRNVGTVPANITAAYMINLDNGNITAQNLSIGVVIPQGNATRVLLFKNADMTPGVTYLVKVVTKNGVEATILFTPR